MSFAESPSFAPQELRVVKSSVLAQQMHARVAKLGVNRHYAMLGMMRALRKWAMLLELDGSYHAALTQAASLMSEHADGVESDLAGAQRQTVQALLVEPSMLAELGEIRRRLQTTHKESESLRTQLRTIVAKNAVEDVQPTPDGAPAAPAGRWLPLAEGDAALRATAPARLPSTVEEAPPASDGAHLATVERPAEPFGAKAKREQAYQEQREVDTLRLQLKLVRTAWRSARAALDKQGLLLRQLSAKRNTELEQLHTHAEVLRRSQMQLHELQVEQTTWRQQSAQQADVIAAAIAAAANKYVEHEEEVKVLSTKLQQLLEERQGLHALVDSQAADLKLMSTEMLKLVG